MDSLFTTAHSKSKKRIPFFSFPRFTCGLLLDLISWIAILCCSQRTPNKFCWRSKKTTTKKAIKWASRYLILGKREVWICYQWALWWNTLIMKLYNTYFTIFTSKEWDTLSEYIQELHKWIGWFEPSSVKWFVASFYLCSSYCHYACVRTLWDTHNSPLEVWPRARCLTMLFICKMG